MPPASARVGRESPADAYDELVARSPQGSLFCTSWWLDAVARERWRPHAVEEKGRIVAAWPTIVAPSRFGDLHLGAPLTPFLGPIFEPHDSAHRRSREIEYLERLVARIEPCAHVEARCNPAFDYWTPLHWHGFTQTTHYTWRLPDLRDPEAVFSGTRENVRREVRKARKHGISVDTAPVSDLLALHGRGAGAQGRGEAARRNRETIERLDGAAGARGARTILVARDGQGRAHSAGLFVHDERWTYYLLGASDPAYRTSGAASLVMWTAIERAAALGRGFDFEGSMLRPVERFVRAFGGIPTPYSLVRKTPSRPFRAATAARRAARAALASLPPRS